jgi:hypothetical protein
MKNEREREIIIKALDIVDLAKEICSSTEYDFEERELGFRIYEQAMKIVRSASTQWS